MSHGQGWLFALGWGRLRKAGAMLKPTRRVRIKRGRCWAGPLCTGPKYDLQRCGKQQKCSLRRVWCVPVTASGMFPGRLLTVGKLHQRRLLTGWPGTKVQGVAQWFHLLWPLGSFVNASWSSMLMFRGCLGLSKQECNEVLEVPCDKGQGRYRTWHFSRSLMTFLKLPTWVGKEADPWAKGWATIFYFLLTSVAVHLRP